MLRPARALGPRPVAPRPPPVPFPTRRVARADRHSHPATGHRVGSAASEFVPLAGSHRGGMHKIWSGIWIGERELRRPGGRVAESARAGPLAGSTATHAGRRRRHPRRAGTERASGFQNSTSDFIPPNLTTLLMQQRLMTHLRPPQPFGHRGRGPAPLPGWGKMAGPSPPARARRRPAPAAPLGPSRPAEPATARPSQASSRCATRPAARPLPGV